MLLRRLVTPVALAATVALAVSGPVGAASGGGATAPGPSTGASGTGATGTTTQPTPLARLQATMARALKPYARGSGAYVLDLDTGQVLFSLNPSTPRYPASVEKLFTLTTALELYGVSGTLETRVYGVGSFGPDGVFDGNLYLRGGGDPTFGDAKFIRDWYGSTGTNVATLSSQLIAATHITHVHGSVIGDESYFDSLRGDPASGFQPDSNLAGKLTALSFDRGETGSQSSSAAHAAWELAGTLRHDGVTVTGKSRAGVTPANATLLASVDSPPMSELAALTAGPSDDFFAEMILKALGARFGAGGTTAAGADVVRTYLLQLGLQPVIADGSGLSRADLASPLQVVTLLRDLSPGGDANLQAVGQALHAALPIVGETGTLASRMIGTAARGNCQAKSGTLSNASDLAGWCDGRYAFALLMNNVPVSRAQDAEDKVVEALAKYATPATPAKPAGLPRRSP